MPNRAKALVTAQIGAESTWGTAVAQTAVLTHIEDINIQPVTPLVRATRLGSMAAGVAADVHQASGTATINKIATYGELGLWLESLYGAATDAGAGPYTHTFDVDPTAAITRIFYTLVKSDGTDAIALAGALVNELTLNFSPDGYVMADVSFVGQQAEDGTLTGSQSDFTDSGQLLLPSELTVYLDAAGSAGGTALNCDALSGSITFSVETPLQFGLGQKKACDYMTRGLDVTVSLSGDASNATIKTEVEKLLGDSPAPASLDLQLTFNKSANYDLTVIVPVKLASAPVWHSDDDGALTFDLEFQAVVDSSSSAGNGFLDVVLTNQDAAI